MSDSPKQAVGKAKRWRQRLVRGAIVAVAFWAGSWAAWEIAVREVPQENVRKYPRGATVVEDREGRELAAFVGQEDAWYMPLKSEEVSPWLKKALVAVEDRRFFEHGGVDWRSVFGAAWEDVRSLAIRRGASTIDMQVERLRNPRHRSWAAKLEQTFRAAQLDRIESKDGILTEYVNRAPFGGNLVGAGAASWRYFGKNCRDLSLGEAALLAGLPQNPNRLRPDRFPEKAAVRRTHVLDCMLAAGMISAEEHERALTEPVAAAWRPLPQENNEQAWGAIPALAAMAGRRPGERVRTTIDAGIQRAAWQAAREKIQAGKTAGVDSAAVVVIDVPTGELRAVVSLSSSTDAVDLTNCARLTGSVLKPFIYAEAFEMGVLGAETEVNDSPAAWAGYVPGNFDKTFRGRMTAAEALAESRNIPAMMVLSKVGIERAIGTMDEAGVRTPADSGRRYGLSLAIGGAEATVREVAEGYATLARGGLRKPARLNAASETTGDSSRALPERACWEVLSCLNQRGRTEEVEGGLAAADLGAAWKTGTSNGLRDAWCCCATPRVVVAVWLGNSGGGGSSGLVGQEAAAPLALQLIGQLDKGGEKFPANSVIVKHVTGLTVNSRLSVVAPAANSEFLLDGEPGRDERIALKSAGGAGTRRWWFINGELAGTSQNGETVWWKGQSGKYTVRVVDENGSASQVAMRIRGEAATSAVTFVESKRQDE